MAQLEEDRTVEYYLKGEAEEAAGKDAKAVDSKDEKLNTLEAG